MSLMMKKSVTEGRGENAPLWSNLTARLRRLPAILAASALLLVSAQTLNDAEDWRKSVPSMTKYFSASSYM